MKLGNQDIARMYLGDRLVNSAYFGTVPIGRTAGIYPCNAIGELTYEKTDDAKYARGTFDSIYDLYYFEIDENGTQHPTESIDNIALSLGENTPITITSTHGNPSIEVTLFLADLIVLNQADGVVIGNPLQAFTASISGGSWSTTDSDPIAGIRIEPAILVPGVNQVNAIQTDGNSVETYSLAIDIDYAPTCKIVKIDGQSTAGEVITDKEYVNGSYLYGGAIIVDGNNYPILDGNGFYEKVGGTLVEFTNYQLTPGDNNVQLTGLQDDFGNFFDTTIETLSKIPALLFNPLAMTGFAEDNVGTNVTIKDALVIDSGQSTELTQDYSAEFVSGAYGTTPRTLSYTYPGTQASNSIEQDIFFGQDEKVFLADGQSNMVGYAAVVALDLRKNISAWSWTAREWIGVDTTQPSTWKNTADPFNGNSQAIYFINKMAELYPTSLVKFMMNAVGGKAIDQWYGNGWMYSKAVTEIGLALPSSSENKISAIIWTQGEQDDDNGTSLDTYRSQRDSVFADYRSESFTDPDMPILTSQMLDAKGAMNPVVEEWDSLYEWEDNYVPCDKNEYQPDQVHFNNVNNQLVGESNAVSYKAIETLANGLEHEFVLSNYSDIDDSVGNRTGSWTGLAYRTDSNGHVISEDKDTYILLDTPITKSTGSAFSLSFGISGSSAANASAYFGSNTDSENDFWIWRGSNLMRFELGTGKGNLDFTVPAGLFDQLTDINQFTITYDGVSDRANLYVNKTATPIQSNIFDKTGIITIERLLSSKIVDFTAAFAPEGGMKYMRVWNRELTTEELSVNSANTQAMNYLVAITSPLEGAIITNEDAPDGFIPVEYTINGVQQQDFFIFENGFDNYTITISYTDPSTGVTGSDSVNVTYEEAAANPDTLAFYRFDASREDSFTETDAAGTPTVGGGYVNDVNSVGTDVSKTLTYDSFPLIKTVASNGLTAFTNSETQQGDVGLQETGNEPWIGAGKQYSTVLVFEHITPVDEHFLLSYNANIGIKFYIDSDVGRVRAQYFDDVSGLKYFYSEPYTEGQTAVIIATVDNGTVNFYDNLGNTQTDLLGDQLTAVKRYILSDRGFRRYGENKFYQWNTYNYVIDPLDIQSFLDFFTNKWSV